MKGLRFIFKILWIVFKNWLTRKKVTSDTTPPTTNLPFPVPSKSTTKAQPTPVIDIKKHFLTSHNRPALKKPKRYQLIELLGIVIHWTGNPSKGANAMANRNYFQNGIDEKGKKVFASTHYIVDDKGIIQCLPDNEVGFHVGDKRKGYYTPYAKKIIKAYQPQYRFKINPNYFFIGIEVCVDDFSDMQLTLQNTYHLVRYLLDKHGGIDIVRHYDLTYKPCPKFPIPEHLNKGSNRKFEFLDGERWEQFKNNCINYNKINNT